MVRWLILLIILLLAGIRFAGIVARTQPVQDGDKISISVRLNADPEAKFGNKTLEIAAIPGKRESILVTLPKEPEVKYGDTVKISGSLERRVIGNKQVGYMMKQSQINILQVGNRYVSEMHELGKRLRQSLLRYLPGDEGVIAAGIVWGGSSSLSETTKNDFQTAGMSHITAASGYNVSVVAGWVLVMGVAVWGRRKAIPFVLICIGMYVLLAGMSAAVVRAGIMGGVTVTGWWWGRRAEAVWLLTLTSAVMLIWNPLWLWDVGWQLSVAATAGILLLNNRKFGDRLHQSSITSIPIFSVVGADLKTTIAAQAATLPLIWYHFGSVSIVAPAANGLMLWLVPIIMQLAAISTGIGMLWEAAGKWAALSVWLPAHMLVEGAGWMAGLPLASIKVFPLPGWGVAIYYAGLLLAAKRWGLFRKLKE